MRVFTTLLCFLMLFFSVGVQAQSNKNFVSVPVIVSDREGRYISGLKKEDFTISQNGVEQKITSFGTEDEPVSIALLIDTSESTRNVLGDIRDAANDFIALLTSKDQCLIATFDSEVKILNPLTSDRDVMKKSLREIRTDEREGTVVFSAVDKVANEGFKKAEGRKVIVLLSDGKDYGSAISKKDLLGELEESDVMIYSIFYQTGSVAIEPRTAEIKEEPKIQQPKEEPKKEKKRKKKGYSIKIAVGKDTNTPEEIKLADTVTSTEAVNVLQEMTDTTAGRIYTSDAPNLSRIFKQIAAELRQQYRLGFNSKTADASDAGNIIVKVNRADAVVQPRGKFRKKL